MTRTALVFVAILPAVAWPVQATGQGGNPFDGDPAAVRAGRALFGNRCAECHGADAKGLNGPDLTVLWSREIRDERVFQTIRSGVSGSVMPSTSAPDHEIWAMVAYLKSVSTVEPFESFAGDAGRGQAVFAATCARCHKVEGQGGITGPDLGLIGRVRTRSALARSIREPSASIARGYRPVSLVTREGSRVRGVVKGEDAFSIQVVEVGGRLQGYLKSDLQEVVREERSLMPAFGEDRVSDAALDDLLAYLGTLR
ncbi:MAG TPA: c-type cytochrome [Longimicrobiales bacterium]|nr:c-type cytochrome [Longimicrobiales bacterium]